MARRATSLLLAAWAMVTTKVAQEGRGAHLGILLVKASELTDTLSHDDSVADRAGSLQGLADAVLRQTHKVGLCLLRCSLHVEAGRYAEAAEADQIGLLLEGSGRALQLRAVADGLEAVARVAHQRLGGRCHATGQLWWLRRVLGHTCESSREAQLGVLTAEARLVRALRVEHGLGMRGAVDGRRILEACREDAPGGAVGLERSLVVALASLERLLDEDLTRLGLNYFFKSDRFSASGFVSWLSHSDVDGLLASRVFSTIARGVHDEDVVGAGGGLVARVAGLHLLAALLLEDGKSVRDHVHHGTSCVLKSHASHAGLAKRLARQRAGRLVGARKLGRGPSSTLNRLLLVRRPLDVASMACLNFSSHVIGNFEDVGSVLVQVQVVSSLELEVSLLLLALELLEKRRLLPVQQLLGLLRRVGLQGSEPGCRGLSARRHLLATREQDWCLAREQGTVRLGLSQIR